MMKKILNPATCVGWTRTGKSVDCNAFVKIEYDKGRLSLSGVIGPLRSGNCRGSAGQCVDEIRKGNPTGEWTREMLDRLCNLWEAWHLNDLHPECEHQRALGWCEDAGKEVNLYHWTLNTDVTPQQRKIKDKVLEAAQKGREISLTREERLILSLDYEVTTWVPQLPSILREFYKPRKRLYPSDRGFIETKTLGYLHPEDHPLGILAKPCPVCGYKYGTSWNTVKVPKEIIDELWMFPATKIKPAWC